MSWNIPGTPRFKCVLCGHPTNACILCESSAVITAYCSPAGDCENPHCFDCTHELRAKFRRAS